MKVTINHGDSEVVILSGLGTTGDEIVQVVLDSLIILGYHPSTIKEAAEVYCESHSDRFVEEAG